MLLFPRGEEIMKIDLTNSVNVKLEGGGEAGESPQTVSRELIMMMLLLLMSLHHTAIDNSYRQPEASSDRQTDIEDYR